MTTDQLRQKLTQKRDNLARSLSTADVLVLRRERELVEAREARAACQGALQQVDETLLDLASPSPPSPAAAPK